jgi:hypothetical protein
LRWPEGRRASSDHRSGAGSRPLQNQEYREAHANVQQPEQRGAKEQGWRKSGQANEEQAVQVAFLPGIRCTKRESTTTSLHFHFPFITARAPWGVLRKVNTSPRTSVWMLSYSPALRRLQVSLHLIHRITNAPRMTTIKNMQCVASDGHEHAVSHLG